MDIASVRAAIAAFPDTLVVEGGGDLYAIYDPDHDYAERPRHGWATVVTSDAHDSASDLDRPGVYRVNLGLSRSRSRVLLDPTAAHDPTALDTLFPHPVYGGQGWVCVLNPDRTWSAVHALLAEAHADAARRHERRRRRPTAAKRG